jgi:indole-3-glycerol phosphate synthase
LRVANVLDEILAHKRTEVEAAKQARPLEMLRAQPGYALPRRNFLGSVTVPRRSRPNLIAEVKRSSPSAGVIREDFDPVSTAQAYERGGAAALSVLTDERYFDGRLEFIEQIKAVVGLPVLRKDFIVDPYQVVESRAAGADAILLIGDALTLEQMQALLALAHQEQLWVLLEVHARDVLLLVLQELRESLQVCGLLGINNRDLQAQETRLEITEELAALVPPGLPLVSESGIKTRADVERMHAAGARALLVGETLMRSGDPQRTIRELFG